MSVRFRPGTVITLFFLMVFLVAVTYGWEWPFIAKLMPVYFIGIPGIAFCLIQLYRDLIGWEPKNPGEGMEMDEVFKEGRDLRTDRVRTLAFFGWFAGGGLGIWLLGIVIALPFMVLLYMLVEGRGEKWMVSLLMSAGVFLFLWGLFEYLLDIHWPPGILFG